MPFEIIADCEMAGFPTSADVERVAKRIETARRSCPPVVRMAMLPPAIFRDRRYVLQARFAVLAKDGTDAARTVEGLLENAKVPCQSVVPSGRALTPTEVPLPIETKPGVRPVKRTQGSRRSRPAESSRRRGARRGRPRITKRRG